MGNNPLPYRPCVAVALFNANGKVFVGERIDTPGAWQMPQGGIDPDENLLIAAKRELKEEIGTDKASLLKVHEPNIKYDLPPHLLGKLWGGQYGGQEQTWVAMRFEGHDSDVRLDADDHPEFSKWQWVALEDTLDLIVPFKRATYEKIIGAFEEFAAPIS
jgi:putative (di)nucleoside polyphosphate hydrolase